MQDMHHITPCRFAKLNGRSRRRSRPLSSVVAPGTGQAHRIELRCRSWPLGKRGRPAPKSCCSLIIEVIILTTQRRANFCGDSDTASLRVFPSSGSSGSGTWAYLAYLSPCFPLAIAVVTADHLCRRACARR